jgi:uncharacterized damage-inducible protein DinB
MDLAENFLARSRHYLQTEYRTKLRAAVEALPADALWWRANEQANSVGNLLLHLNGNVRQGIVSGVGGAPSLRDRAGEFDARSGPTTDALLSQLGRTLGEVDAVLAGLSAADLSTMRTIQGRDVTVFEAVYHVVEHFAMHMGQIIFVAKLHAPGTVRFYEDAGGLARPLWPDLARQLDGAQVKPPEFVPPANVPNAGLVLLNPFLVQLFDRAQLLERDEAGRARFRSTDSAARGVQLLEYLAGRSEKPTDHSRTLPRVLCGVASDLELPQAGNVTDVERELCQKLLEAVISQWAEMKNSSVVGLQETFLQRSGVLTETADAFDLRVERRTIDVLVDQLPWSFSRVQFQWMSAALVVRW